MISLDDFYKVMCAMVPLYFAMLIAYASVKWWKIFTPDQCSGINRFVAVFAIPVLSFHFISQNNPYEMDTKFICADTLSKVLVLFLLSIWAFLKGKLKWLITLFSVATLPNTLVLGIPLLKAMYGDFTQSLMVQLVVLQCIIWYTLLLFLFEYRAATILIHTQFPGSAATAITKFKIDGDVISLDGRDPLCTDSEIDGQGRVCVRIRRSTSSAPDSSYVGISPRSSNLSGAEVYSINTPTRPNGYFHGSNNSDVVFGSELAFGCKPTSPQLSGYASSDVYSLQPTPRASNFNELDTNTVTSAHTPTSRSPVTVRLFRQPSPAFSPGKMTWQSPEEHGCRDADVAEKDLSFRECSSISMLEEGDRQGNDESTNQEMPSGVVMLRLIVIMVGRKLSRNPNTYSSLLGLLWSLISFKWNVGVPSLVMYSIKLISDAGLGMAMFSLGLFMALQPRIIACGAKMAAIGMLIRFIGGPLLMYSVSLAVGLRGVRLHTAIVQAALPQGIVPFVFAREYGLHPDILSTGVIFGMLVSLPVTLLYYVLLGL